MTYAEKALYSYWEGSGEIDRKHDLWKLQRGRRKKRQTVSARSSFNEEACSGALGLQAPAFALTDALSQICTLIVQQTGITDFEWEVTVVEDETVSCRYELNCCCGSKGWRKILWFFLREFCIFPAQCYVPAGRQNYRPHRTVRCFEGGYRAGES